MKLFDRKLRGKNINLIKEEAQIETILWGAIIFSMKCQKMKWFGHF